MNQAIGFVRSKMDDDGIVNYSDLNSSDQFYLTVTRLLNSIGEDCAPHQSSSYSGVKLTSDPTYYTEKCGTSWNVLSSDNINDCD